MSFSDHSSPSLALTSAPAFRSALMISGLGTFSDAASVRALAPVWKSKFYGALVLNRRVVLHTIDATPAR